MKIKKAMKKLIDALPENYTINVYRSIWRYGSGGVDVEDNFGISIYSKDDRSPVYYDARPSNELPALVADALEAVFEEAEKANENL